MNHIVYDPFCIEATAQFRAALGQGREGELGV
jgi:hypothetical protein